MGGAGVDGRDDAVLARVGAVAEAEDLPPVPKPKQKQEETHDLTFVVPPGISLGLELNDAPDGNEIASVEFGSWAMVMALRVHDRLVRCGTVDVDGASSFGEILAAQRAAQSPGEPLHLVVRRKGKTPAAAAAAAAVPANYDFGPTSAAWRAGGFVSDDPIAELGAEPIGAAAALHFYLWLAEKVPKVARRILERQERARARERRRARFPARRRRRPRHPPRRRAPPRPEAWRRRGLGEGSVGAAWRGAAVKQPWALADSRDALHLLIATALEYLEAQFASSAAGVWAEFPGCAKRCEQQMRAVLDGGGPLSHATLRSKLGLGAWEGPIAHAGGELKTPNRCVRVR